jgi:hypothetical protein
MANEWHYTKNGQRFGPVSGQQLKELAAKGGIGPDDLVWKEGMPQWVPASKIKGLLPSSAPNATEPPPVPPVVDTAETQPPAQAPASKLATLRTATSEKAQAVLGRAKSIWSKLSLKQRLLVGGGAVGLCVLLLLVFMLLFGGQGVVSADELAATFTASRDSATSRYKGRVIRVSGVVSGPGARLLQDDKGQSYELASVIVKTNTPLRVRCDFKDPTISYDQAASLRGQLLVLKGECRGVESSGDIWIKDCELVSSSRPVANGKANANANSAYDSGYQEGLSLGNEYARRLQGMAPAAQNEFRNVYANELRTHERNRDEVIRAYGAESNNGQNKKGFCDGLREALQKAGIN